MAKTHGGKGSAPRPAGVSKEVVDQNWENIFGKKTREHEIVKVEAQQLYEIPLENPGYKFAGEISQEYDCPESGIDFDLHGTDILALGESCYCSGCGKHHTAGKDIDLNTYIRLPDGTLSCRHTPKNAEEKAALINHSLEVKLGLSPGMLQDDEAKFSTAEIQLEHRVGDCSSKEVRKHSMKKETHVLVIEPPARPGQSYGVLCPDYPGFASAGDTLEEAITNAREGLVSHIQLSREIGEMQPERLTSLEKAKDAQCWVGYYVVEIIINV